MKDATFFIKENISGSWVKVKEWGQTVDKILVSELIIVLLLIFLKVYINGRYIFEVNKASLAKKAMIKTESDAKKLKMLLAKYKNKEKLNVMSKTLNMEEDIEVVVVK